jgi:hypothetical protein
MISVSFHLQFFLIFVFLLVTLDLKGLVDCGSCFSCPFHFKVASVWSVVVINVDFL